MTGSLQIKQDKYYIVLNLYENGKRKQKWIGTDLPIRGNKKRAEKLLRDALQAYEEREQQQPQCDQLFSDVVRDWLKAVAIRVDEVTLQGYEALAKLHILPHFDASGIKLADVDRQTLQHYIDGKFRNGRADGKGGLSPASMRLHKNILYQTLKEAVLNDLIAANPCEFVTLPQTVRHEAKFYSADQLATLLETIKGEPIYPLVKATTVYGLRRSEVLGLKWDSVDFAADTLTIKHTVAKVSSVLEKDKTKNASSRRSFPLLPEVKSMLLAIREQEAENRKLFGKSYVENGYIFKWDNGVPFSPDYVSQRFARLLQLHGFPHIRFHELRHSCASTLLAMGFNLKDVQEWLGHADIKMTANIYAHLDVKRKQNMADMLGGTLLKQGPC